MQQQEKDKLEERIVAYFEGELDPASGKQLLADVAKNTESRALFKSHESLNSLINAARVPMEVPLEAKRSIAERIPGLIAFIPGLLGGAQAIPVLTQSGSSLFGFLAKIPLSTAISVGTSVAVLTTAGVIVKNKMDANADADRKAKVVLMQNQTKVSDANQQYYMAPLPTKDVAVPNVGSASATVVGGEGSGTSTTGNTSSTNMSSSSMPPIGASSEQATTHNLRAMTPAAAAAGTLHAPSAIATENAHKTNQSTPADNSSVSNKSIRTDIADKGVASNADTKDIRQTESNSSNGGQLPTTNTASNGAPVKEVPPAAISEVVPTTVAVANAAGIPLPRTSMMGTLSTDGESMLLRPFIFSEVRWLALPAINNDPFADFSPSQSGTTATSNVGFGLDAVLSDAFALRFEVGNTSFGQYRRLEPWVAALDGSYSHAATSPVPPSRYTYTSRVELTSAWWTTAGVVYSFDLGLPLRLFVSADGGAALMPTGPGWMTGIGLSSEFDLNSHFTIKPGVTYNAAWIPEAQSWVTDGYHPGDGVVEHRELSGTGTLLNSSFGINVGLLFRF